jgi:hypothetical protein
MRAAATIATAAAPMLTPAIPPGERPDEWVVLTAAAVVVAAAVGADVEEEDLDVGAELAWVENGSGVLSAGQGSPGSSMKVEFSAICRCTASVSFALGLMAPTMP